MYAGMTRKGKAKVKLAHLI